jgi:hypothetical protein
MSDLTDRIRSEASIADRPGQHDRLEAIAVEVEALTAERDRLKRGGRTLGKTLDYWLLLVADVTNSRDMLDEDGDGDWALIAERLAAMKVAQ